MPRRKKNSQSPARLPAGPSEGGNLGSHSETCRLSQGFAGAMATNRLPSQTLSTTDREKIVQNMKEMFSHLEPEVIETVLSECDFKVENAMDPLLELSEAAAIAVPISSSVSGFEHTAAALLSPHHFGECRPPVYSQPLQRLPSPPTIMSEELDLLIDQELETLTALQDMEEDQTNSQLIFPENILSSLPPPQFPHQAFPELLQASVRPELSGPSAVQSCHERALVQYKSGPPSPLEQRSTLADGTSGDQQSVMEVKHSINITSEDNSNLPLDLAASGRPSAFQVYKRKETPNPVSDLAKVLPSEDVVGGGVRSKVNTTSWNLDSPVFCPRNQGNQGGYFITPVAPSPWCNQPRHTSHWLSNRPASQAPLKPYATIPKSWAVPAAPHQSTRSSGLYLEGKVLVLLRGAPGSGKSTLARALQEHNPGGVVLSSDDYFIHNGQYHFDPSARGEAHEWNHKRAKEAFERGDKPIIIDNTNMQGWEMKPYVAQALKHKYQVQFREPDTWWKNKPRELERRTTHNVPMEKIRRMLAGYDRFVTVRSIMGSSMPESKLREHEKKSQRPDTFDAPCPDLIKEPGLTERAVKNRPHLFSSLPDVSSIVQSSDRLLEDCGHKSTDTLSCQVTGKLTKPTEIPTDEMDLRSQDAELGIHLEQNNQREDQRIPDCIVESVVNEYPHQDEIPEAFFESIRQRVQRERRSRRTDFDNKGPADLVKDTNILDKEEMEDAEITEDAEVYKQEGEKEIPNMLDFEGDWPPERSLEQRQMRTTEGHKNRKAKDDTLLMEVNENAGKFQSGSDVTEFQKLLDLVQAGFPGLNTGSICSSPSSSPTCVASVSGGELVDSSTSEESDDPRFENEETSTNTVCISRADLLDCLLDRKPADSSANELVGLEIESGNIEITGDLVFGNGSDIDTRGYKSASTKFFSAANTVIPCAATECEGGGSCSNDNEDGTELGAVPHAERKTNNCTDQADREMTLHLDVPVHDSSVDAGSGQERKQRRRSGKQCKLALTFTQNSPASSPKPLQCPKAPAQIESSCQNSNTNCEQILDHKCNVSINVNPNADLQIMSISEGHMQPSSPFSLLDVGCSVQTEPQDFALLWRVNCQDGSADTVVMSRHSNDIKILSGNSTRFLPEKSSAVSAAVAVHPFHHKEVPYRVVHEKSTQVDEKEFGPSQDWLECMRILSRHFRLVGFDTLEDLFNKCQHDLDWTINLLLDSGERFFKDEDSEVEDTEETDDQTTDPALAEHTRSGYDILEEIPLTGLKNSEPTGSVEITKQPASDVVGSSEESANNTGLQNVADTASPVRSKTHSDQVTSSQADSCLTAPEKIEICDKVDDGVTLVDIGSGAWGVSAIDSVITEDPGVGIEKDMASRAEVQRLVLAESKKVESQGRKRREERIDRSMEQRRSEHLDIQSLELILSTELALQLTELFGPVGVDPGTCTADDCAVQMDMNLAKLLHGKWKQTIHEKKSQATLPYHLLQETLENQPEPLVEMPYMDHWNFSNPYVSLRAIIKEEQALQENMAKIRRHANFDRHNGATLVKEETLYSLFPTIDRHFLQDIFRDHNYSLTQTELFLRSLLEEGPVKTVVAPEVPTYDRHRAASKERDKKVKSLDLSVLPYQDMEDPEYEDFRAEANLQRKRKLESFSKAAEAYKAGHKEVASFYAQQGHIHGLQMREANHRAAVQIFQRVNSSLLPENILDLHGLHVDEALKHLAQVLKDKTTECRQGLCQPQLRVITGRGNHSQGGVARIRPAVINYLTNKHHRFKEPKPGIIWVSLT